MCSIFFAWENHPRFKLIIAANRDEFYDRPTRPSDFHGSHKHILSGTDLKAGGTWMGITRTGRFSALTNYRDMSNIREDAPSRGNIVLDYLDSDLPPKTFHKQRLENAHVYNSFNLITGTTADLYYYSNVQGEYAKLKPGNYGLSNHLLNTPWPKVQRGMAGLESGLAQIQPDTMMDHLFTVLENQELADDESLPDTGIGLEFERVLSPIFIQSEKYGTRTSTVLIISRAGEVYWVEKSFEKGIYTDRIDRYFIIEQKLKIK